MKKVKLVNVATVLNVKNISHRAGASVCNALLKDLNMISENDIIDPSRVQRAKQKVREMATDQHLKQLKSFIAESKIIGLFFDGKKDQTLNIIQNPETNQYHPRTESQNHYAIMIEPGNQYYTHVTPEGSTAVDTARCIYQKLIKDGIDCDKIHIVGSDGTVFNTGHLSGIYQSN